MMAGPSVAAVKHSGVFSCDWDSLDEENVRHGAWLSACWSSSRGLRENGKQAELPSSLSLCRPPSFLAPSFAPAAASSILLSFPLLHLSAGVHLLWFTEAHYQFPANLHQRLASQQQHTTTRSKPREGWQHDWCLPKNSLLLTCVANPSCCLCVVLECC